MQDCEPSRNILCFSETSSSDWTSTFLPDLLQQTYGESELPWQLRDLAFMLWLLPYKVGIFVESLGQFLSGEELWITIFAPLPLGTRRWKEQELLRYSCELKQPDLSNLWAGQDWGDVCTGLEPWDHIQGSHLSFVCLSLKLKSRCPAALTDTSSLGLKPFGKSGRWLWTNGNWVSGGAKSFISKLSFIRAHY